MRSDELVLQLGQAVLADERLKGRDRAQLSLVCIIEPGVLRVGGYAFDEDGEATPMVPEDDAVDDLFGELHDAVRALKDVGWKSCLVRIERPDPKVTADFEYGNASRWKSVADSMDDVFWALRA